MQLRQNTNLQIEIDEIDGKIDDVLKEMEETNCNAAEGYKIFKKLKELRINRREKQQELNCMYALTDYIDCEALADTYEGNLAEVEDIMNVKENDDAMVVAENQAVQKSADLFASTPPNMLY